MQRGGSGTQGRDVLGKSGEQARRVLAEIEVPAAE